MKFLQPPTIPALAADPTVTTGALYVNSTTGFKWYDGAAWHTEMDLESAQTVAGTKTFSSVTIATLTLTNALAQAKTHASPDTDTASTSLHHTLGTGAFQAAAGNHTHDASGIVSGLLPIARGGTNSAATPTAGGVGYGSGSALAYTGAGTANQALVSTGAGAPAWATLDLTYLPQSWAKKSCRVVATANITLSGLQTIDGVALNAGDRVLVGYQTTGSQNGIYVAAAGAWTRATDADTSSKIAGAQTTIDEGTSYGGLTFSTSFKPVDTLGTTSMSWGVVLNQLVGVDLSSPQTISGAKTFSADTTFNGDLIDSTGKHYARGYVPGTYKYTTVNSGTAVSATKVVPLSGISVTLVGGRYYKIHLQGMAYVATVGNVANISVYQDGVEIGRTQVYCPTAAGFGFHYARLLGSSSSAAHTYDIYVWGSGGGGIAAGGSYPAEVWIEDVGSY